LNRQPVTIPASHLHDGSTPSSSNIFAEQYSIIERWQSGCRNIHGIDVALEVLRFRPDDITIAALGGPISPHTTN